MSIADFKTVFDTLDYSGSGELDFSEFCLMNTDKTNDVDKYVKDIHSKWKQKAQKEEKLALSNINDYYIGKSYLHSSTP